MFAVFTDQACTANIYSHEFNVACACMLQKGCYSAKTFLIIYLRKFIPSKIYGIYAMDFYTEMQTFSWYDIIAFKDFLILETGVIKVKAHNYLRDKAVANLVIIIILYHQPTVQGREII